MSGAGRRPLAAYTHRLPVLAGFKTYYGMAVSWVHGEDAIVALGHNANGRAVIAAFNMHQVADCEQPELISVLDYEKHERPDDMLCATWAVNETGDPENWRLRWPVGPDVEGAFPITVWMG